MNIKNLKELINNLPDNIEIKVNSIQVTENELEPSDISEAHLDANHGFVITPTVISLNAKNEYETKATKNYKTHQREIAKISIQDIVKASDYINELATLIPNNNEVLDYLNDIQTPLINIIKNCQVNKECPKCGCILYTSDLPQYDYICPECDENFYKCEVKGDFE